MEMFLPKRLHPYSLDHLHNAISVQYLGSGAFGEVRLYKCMDKCKDKICGECFVVKRSLKKNNKVSKKHLLNEYTIGTLLHHKNIRETLDIDLIDYSLIFENCPGVDFFTLLCNDFHREYSLLEHLDYFSQLIDAVEYMHSIGIAHRDIKLENVMIDKSTKCLKLIDFGEACVYKRNVCESDRMINIRASGICGTVPYIPPEEFTELDYDPQKADIWALGVILYGIVYNSFPWMKAHETVKRYMRHVTYFLDNCNMLDPIIFPDCKENMFTRELFALMLNPDPELRSDIFRIQSCMKIHIKKPCL